MALHTTIDWNVLGPLLARAGSALGVAAPTQRKVSIEDRNYSLATIWVYLYDASGFAGGLSADLQGNVKSVSRPQRN